MIAEQGQVLNQILVYSVSQDSSAEYDTEKIKFHHRNIKELCLTEEKVNTYGLYGTKRSIENFLNSIPNQQQFSFFYNQDQDREEGAQIIFLQTQASIIPCLVLPISFLLKKPVDDKTILLTLFRILTDLAQTIIICIDSEIFSDWYSGEIIPFNDLIDTKIKQYTIEKNIEENLLTKDIELKNSVLPSLINWKISPPRNHSQQFLFYNNLQFTSQDYENLTTCLGKILIQMIFNCFQVTDCKLDQCIQDYLPPEFVNQKLLTNKLKEEEKKYFEKISSLWKDIEKQIQKKINSKYGFENREVYIKEKIQTLFINQLKTNLIISFSPFQYGPNKNQQNKLDNLDLSCFQLDLIDIRGNIERILNEIYFSSNSKNVPKIVQTFQKAYADQSSILLTKGKFSAIRKTDKDNSIQTLTINSYTQITIDDSQISGQTKAQLKLIDYFTLNNLETIIIQKGARYMLFTSENKKIFKQIFSVQSESNLVFLSIPQKNQLYAFNKCSNRDVILLQCFEGQKKMDSVVFFDVQNLTQVQQVVYLKQSQKFICLSSEGMVYSWVGDKNEFNAIQTVKFLEGNNSRITMNFQPSLNQTNHYNQLSDCPTGKRFFLGNSYIIDIYNDTYELIKSIDVKGYFLLFSENQDAFIVTFDELKWKQQTKSATVLLNISKDQFIKEINNDDSHEKVIGNPFFDLLKGSQVKYGPVEKFLFNNSDSSIQLFFANAVQYQDQISRYLNQLAIDENYKFIFPNDEQFIETVKKRNLIANSIYRFTYTRVPLQLCTIENNQLIPLIDGFRKPINYSQSLTVSQRAKLLKLGYIEEYLNDLDQKIFVISIIGKQSSGKSYLLNRLFGTRFSVAASRCTDGIWASITQINDQKFLILDCEGLFSAQRTQNEEIQLLAFLAGICDITISNQDLSFSRELDKLMDNLACATYKLTGDSLFKGTLLIALRDINQKENKSAESQLQDSIQKNLAKKNSGFLDTLFSKSFHTYLFSNFENEKFRKELEQLRNHFYKQANERNRWQNGKDLVQTIKILLIQLETQDAENTDDLHFKLKLENITDKLKRLWADFQIAESIQYKERYYQQKSYQFWMEDNELSKQVAFEQLLITIKKDLGLDNSISKHNDNQIEIQLFIKVLLYMRKEYIQKSFEKEISNIQQQLENEFVLASKVGLIRYIEEQEEFYKLCQMKCSQCFLSCSQFHNHSIYFSTEINTKDSQLQNLLKKHKIGTDEERNVENELDIASKAENQIVGSIELCHNSIFFFENYKKLIDVIIQLKQLADSLQKNELIDETTLKDVNFYKLTQKYRSLNKYNFLQNEIIHYQVSENQTTDCNSFQQFMEQKKVILTGSLSFVKTQLTDLQEQDQNIIQKVQAFQEKLQHAKKEKKDLNVKMQKQIQEMQTIEQQKLLAEQNIKSLAQQIQDLLNNIISRNINHYFENQNCDIQQQLNYFLISIKGIDQIISSKYSKIQSDTKNLTNLEEETKLKIVSFQKGLDSISDLDFLNESIQQYNRSIKLREKHTLLSQLLNYTKQKIWIKKTKPLLSDFQYYLQYIQLEQNLTFQQIKSQIEKYQGDIENEINSLNDLDVTSKTEIFLQNHEWFQKPQEFKLKFIEKKKQDFWDEFNENKEELESTLAREKKEMQGFENQKQDLQICMRYCTLKIQVQDCQIQSQNFETQLSDLIISQNLDKKQETLTTQNIEQIETVIPEFEQQLNQIKQSLIDQNNCLNELSECIFVIENVSTIYKDCQRLIETYYKIKQQEEDLEQLLQNYSEMNFARENYKNSEMIQACISENQKQLDQLKDQYNKNQQEIEILLDIQRDMIQIQQLQSLLNDLKQQEKQQHSCLRESHKCDEICEVCKNTYCIKPAGHQQHHLCDLPTHQCNSVCSVKECNKFCKLLYLHDGSHNCSEKHRCKILCQYCGGDCQFDYTVAHQEHICKLNSCIQKCLLCGRSCMENHSHSRVQGNVHICENQHSCEKFCNTPGVCVWEYLEEKREWKTATSCFKFTYFKQVDGGKQNCSIQIQPGGISHGENHSCRVEIHRCGVKCPECDGLCTKDYGHQGFHFAKQHRNKDNQIFTLTVGQGAEIEFKENLETHKYQVGENSSPETCSQSCARRSRAHFHLIQCPGGLNCLEKKNNYARHQREIYQGFEDVQFDEVQCFEFWKLYQWEHPLSTGEIYTLQQIQQCNFYCPFCSVQMKSFCTQKAWHSESKIYADHSFCCNHEEENKFLGLDIVFVIDATGSMSSYIEKVKLMIKEIMSKAKLQFKSQIRFGVVAYRDHPPEDKTFITIKEDLDIESKALNFLQALKADGGGDYPEAVLDGLKEAVNLKWLEKHDRMIFLVGDAPPHGKVYSNRSHWPEGCPCGIKEKDLFDEMNKNKIRFKILKLDDGLEVMIKEFQKYIELEVLHQNSKIDFVQQVVTKVCQQIEMREITFKKK